MNKNLKNAIREEFAAPPPRRKAAFLRSLPTPAIGLWEFVWTQGAYIRKWVWGVTALVFATALVGVRWMEEDLLWCVSALMPVLALAVITEWGRAEAWGMAELELATRFSRKAVVLARLGILGAVTLVLLGAVTPMVGRSGQLALIRAGVYMLCPYLLTVFLGLGALRRVRGTEGLYVCGGIAATVSAGHTALTQAVSALYEASNFIWWLALLALLGVGAAKQGRQMMKRTEELAWNL